MPGERYVLLGLAQGRAGWFRAVGQWANSGTIPAEFVKCVSVEEVRARLGSARRFSALLVDATLPTLDRDLVDLADSAGCPVVAVDDRRRTRDWEALGIGAVLPDFFDPKALLDVLAPCASMIDRGDTVPGDPLPLGALDPLVPATGRVATVLGPGGTGASTVAICLAQGLAQPASPPGVVLADLALRADQAMLHDARDVAPGIQELVEDHRAHRRAPDEVRTVAFDVRDRGYHLVLGLRRARAWSVLRPRAFEAAFESLRAAYGVVVCDTDADLEGEEEGGSVDVEERNVMARTAVSRADVVFAVGLPGMKGTHALARTLDDLRSFGVPASQVVPVVNRGPRSPRARAEVAAALSALAAAGGPSPVPPVFLPDKRVDDLLRDDVRLPASLTEPLAAAFASVVGRDQRGGHGRRHGRGPERVRPGSLGAWTGGADDQEAAASG